MFRKLSLGVAAFAIGMLGASPDFVSAVPGALAQEHGSGGHGSGGGSGSGQHKGANPNCAYQDGSGRGGFGPGGGPHRGGSGEHNDTSVQPDESGNAASAAAGAPAGGGSGGGEGYVCDSPGNWHAGPKIFGH